MNDKEFIDVFNEYYPFERYILKNPKSIENLFDDLLLTEIFVPKTEITKSGPAKIVPKTISTGGISVDPSATMAAGNY
jgi:hypothetical protein